MASGHSVGQGELEGFGTHELASGAGLRVRFIPGAGMVCASLEDRGVELLGRRGGLSEWVRGGETLGIPLLHPWANRLSRHGFSVGDVSVAWPEDALGVARDGSGLPIHGVMSRASDWRVLDHRVTDESARLRATLDFTADAARRAVFPFEHELEVEATLSGRVLRVETTVRATGERAVPIAFGWHPWLQLPGVARADWHVRLPVARRLELDARCLPTGASDACSIPPGPLGTRSYDDLFDGLVPGEPFVLEGGGRRIEVGFGEGFEVAVVYAPLDDDVVCFEPMTAPTNPFEGGFPLRTVAPGQLFAAAFTLEVIETG